MTVEIVKTEAISGQKPGTSGLRKTVSTFQESHYLENYIQSIFNALGGGQRKRLLLGGDGRFFNREAIQKIIEIACGNGLAELYIAKHGILSTPAASLIIRQQSLDGGFILSASHNAGGPKGDFGVKFNLANGGPANDSFSDAIYQHSLKLQHFKKFISPGIDIDKIQKTVLGQMKIFIIDAVSPYVELMQDLFDFDNIAQHIRHEQLKIKFDAMHAVTGPYAEAIFQQALELSPECLLNCVPLEDFGGAHPDPNLLHAKQLVAMTQGENAIDFAAASDGDGDRNMILGKNTFISPSDSLAILLAHCKYVPQYRQLAGVARSMPTSRAVDHVALELDIPCYETPTGWKYFGNLLDNNLIDICGEESFGTGSSHIREKDGIWAVLFWLHIMAKRKLSVADILAEHWAQYGRTVYSRHDYESIDPILAQDFMQHLEHQIKELSGTTIDNTSIAVSDNFSYHDPVDNSISSKQGIRFITEKGDRIIYRMSGTGTQDATIRVYLERYINDPNLYAHDTQDLLKPMIHLSETISQINSFLNKPPDVIT